MKTKFENDDGPIKIYSDLAGVVSLKTVKLWIKKIKDTGSIDLFSPSGRSRTARTEVNILKEKMRLDQKRVLREDLGCFPYKKIKQPKLTDVQKNKRVTFANWFLNNYTKSEITKWLFSDKKYFDLNGI